MNTKKSSFIDNKKDMTFGAFEMTLRALDGQSVDIDNGVAYFNKNGKMVAGRKVVEIERDLVVESPPFLMKAKMRDVKTVVSSATGMMFEGDITTSQYTQIIEDAMRKNPDHIANLGVYTQTFDNFKNIEPVLTSKYDNHFTRI